MNATANALSELYQIIPASTPAELVARLKETGWQDLPPMSRAFAIEFVSGRGTIKAAAEALGITPMEARREYNSPVTRAFIATLQDEIAAHRVINAQWVESQLMELWPKLIGEEDVALVSPAGEQILARKFHAADVTSLLKHFGGDANKVKNTGVQISINFDGMGITAPTINLVESSP